MSDNQRETASDATRNPLVWYVYILEFEDGGYYIGQPNSLTERVAEHAMGAGAESTAGRPHKLVWFNQTHDRESAIKMENRLQDAVERRPLKVKEMVGSFDNLLKLVKPDKTLQELRDDEKKYIRDNGRLFHHVPVTLRPFNSAACGWGGGPQGQLYGTSDWTVLAKDAETFDKVMGVAGEEAARRAVMGRPLAADA